MRTVNISVRYHTRWGQNIYISESINELGNWDKTNLIPLKYSSNDLWEIKLKLPQATNELSFRFYVVQDNNIIRKEHGFAHQIVLPKSDCSIRCEWQDKLIQSYFYTSPFFNSIFKHCYKQLDPNENFKLQIVNSCIHVEHSQELVICGASERLGNWDGEMAPALTPSSFGKWRICFESLSLEEDTLYKFAIRDKETKKIVEWEEGQNRILRISEIDTNTHIVETHYRKSLNYWKASGVAIPVFSLRSKSSFGIGEFSDLKLLTDWAEKAKMRVIQVLPINDTSATHMWHDSYPYSTISIYALHPIYLGLSAFPLSDSKKNKEYTDQAQKLNILSSLDYDRVIKLKTDYIEDLFEEQGKEVLDTEKYKNFYAQNKEWLFPYACFCSLRDKYKTSNIYNWEEYSFYDSIRLIELLSTDKIASKNFLKACFTQYLLHAQLTEAKQYAYSKGIVLKGDIPIGISPNSVEAWVEPHLFNLDTQTGAPPDDFSTSGQNWGFPTYNWDEMRKDNYSWWTKRFTKMSDYFDIYRIDHILGFFRIWEIPISSVDGLLGYFNPALPLSKEELKSRGVFYAEEMSEAAIHQDDLTQVFGQYTEEVKENYLQKRGDHFLLKEKVNTQRKIQNYFSTSKDAKSLVINNGLRRVCNEVFFVRDKYGEDKLHPRIDLYKTLRYNRLDQNSKDILFSIYSDYFYERHTQFWRDEAMKKLPVLIHSTKMLACGEDLGMVPDSVHPVMEQLEILTLEIQRMPKQSGIRYSDLSKLPYLSVSTTSTHDMSPLRMWWEEDRESTQFYYNNVLKIEGEAPIQCTETICTRIIEDHLNSPAMLTIIPLQDWLSIDDKIRREDLNEERINIPAEAHHNWNYRMHINLEDLIKEEQFTESLLGLNRNSGRC